MEASGDLENRFFEGKVKFFDPKNNFGFIQVPDAGLELYFNGKGTPEGIKEGATVKFKIKDGKKGLAAFEISLLDN